LVEPNAAQGKSEASSQDATERGQYGQIDRDQPTAQGLGSWRKMQKQKQDNRRKQAAYEQPNGRRYNREYCRDQDIQS
jgi:hypothetical protein